MEGGLYRYSFISSRQGMRRGEFKKFKLGCAGLSEVGFISAAEQQTSLLVESSVKTRLLGGSRTAMGSRRTPHY